MKTLAKLTYLALLSSLFFWVSPGQADDVVINFEDQTVQTANQLVIATPKLTVTISRPGASFGIEDPQAGSFGQRTLGPGGNFSNTRFVADFSVPLTSITFEIGDHDSQFLADFDRLTVTAYSAPGATGDLLQTESISCCGEAGFSSASITITAPGIKSIEFMGGSLLSPNSVFYDNFALTLENQVVDVDKDGVSDDVDTCKGSDLSKTVVIDGCVTETPNITWYNSGCTTSDYVTACANNAKNHGHFVKCVGEFSKSLVEHGFVRSEHRGEIQACAAQASLP